MTDISVLEADITKLPVDVIVNAANSSLQSGEVDCFGQTYRPQ